MNIIIGLGNPGSKFENTRHNVGFMAISQFARENNFPEFKLDKKSDAEISQGEINGKKILLVKPQTFMNESGKAVQKILSKIKDQVKNIIVIHDDIDLPLGKIKISKDRGSAGHKGVESIIQAIGNENLIRVRIGIASTLETKAIDVVLKKFSEDEQKPVKEAIQKSVQAAQSILAEGLEKSMNQFNQ